MAITESGLYFATFASALGGGSTLDLTQETAFNWALLSNSATPNFLTDTAWNNTNEVTGGAPWPTGGISFDDAGAGLSSLNPTFTVSGARIKWDMNDLSVSGVTFTAARAARAYRPAPTTPIADPLFILVDFLEDIDVTDSTFEIEWSPDGVLFFAREDEA